MAVSAIAGTAEEVEVTPRRAMRAQARLVRVQAEEEVAAGRASTTSATLAAEELAQTAWFAWSRTSERTRRTKP
jgi:DTW domain-containing protein YfiP